MFTHLVPLILIIGSLVAAPVGAAGPPAPGQVRQDVVVGGADDDPDGVGGADVTVEEVEVVLPAADEVVPVEPEVVEQQPEAAEVVSTDEVAIAEVAVEDRVVSPVVQSDGFQTLGVTWTDGSGEAPTDIQVRTLGEEGWSDWAPLEIADDAPDAGSPDAQNAVRAGTDPLWVGDAEAVQLSFAAQQEAGPADLRLSLIGSEEVAAPAGDAVVGTAGGGVAEVSRAAFLPAFVPTEGEGATAVPAAEAMPASVPTIITRAQWGAAPQSCTPSTASKLVGAVVHHTAGSNSYATVGQAMQQIRNDQQYHMVSRGWCDLGYNFVVDKWGNIYEGRARSMTQAVIGVHAGGFNTGNLGVSMLGTYDAAPPRAAQEAVGRIIGFRLGAYGVDPGSTMSYYTAGGENSKIKAGTTITLPRVFGHRDVAYTACPGNGGYAALPAIRQTAREVSAAVRNQGARAVVTAMYHDLLGRAPDPAGLSDWTWRLATGSSAVDVAAAVTVTEEYNRRKIAEAYRTVLGRSTDEQGVFSWLEAINRGTVKIDEIANHLVVSPEFYLRSGATDAGLVRNMYTSVLGRAGSEAEIIYWTDRIPTIGRAGVIEHIMGSREAAQREVQQNYRLFLGRLPDVVGMNHWTDVHLTKGEAAVRAHLVGSEEYRLRAISRYP